MDEERDFSAQNGRCLLAPEHLLELDGEDGPFPGIIYPED